MSGNDDAVQLLERLNRTAEQWSQLAAVGEPGPELALSVVDLAERLSNLVRGMAASIHGASLAIQGDFERAEKLFFRAADLVSEYPILKADNLTRMGNLRTVQHHFAEAERLFNDALDLAVSAASKARISRTRICQGALEYIRGRYKAARAFFLEALDHTDRDSDDCNSFVVGIHNLLTIQVIAGDSQADYPPDFEGDIDSLTNRFPRLSMARLRVSWIRSLLDLRRERLRRAIRSLEAVLRRLIKDGRPDEVLAAALDLGEAYYRKGDLQKVVDTLRAANRINNDKTSNPQIDEYITTLEKEDAGQIFNPWVLRRQLIAIRQHN